MHILIFQQIVFPKGGHYALKDLSATDYDVIGIDWTVNPAEARKIVGDGVTLQGNLDPCALYASKVVIKAINLVSGWVHIASVLKLLQDELAVHAKKQCESFGSQRWIANLGHGIYPDVNPDHLGAYIEALQRISAK